MHRNTDLGLPAAPLACGATLADLAKSRLHAAPVLHPMSGGGPSDFDLNPETKSQLLTPPGYRPAAVLVAIIARLEPHVLLTQRTATLSQHPGQIAFPGGTVDAGDSGPVMTALREAHEEIGLSPSAVNPLGCLDCYRTGTGFVITPVVAMVDPGFELALNRVEVESSFEVPLAFLMDPANHSIDTRVVQGLARRFYAITYEGRYIWGATAGIVRNMYERLFAP